jgi:tetratricopeptide (TPR) repeat protein
MQQLAREVVASDPDFALGAYYLSAVTRPPESQRHLDTAVELAGKASSGERRFIEAMVLARGPSPEDAIEALETLGREYPAERPIQMILGQIYNNLSHPEKARAAFERAMKIDASTPRAPAFLGNLYVLKGDYARARELFESAETMLPSGAMPYAVRFGHAYTHLYQGRPEAAIASLQAYLDEHRKARGEADYPEVYIWHAIARIQLESGQLEQAMVSYEKGYESVPGSDLPDDEKQLWLGRVVHGRGRVLARMGRHQEAWETVESVMAMIEEGGKEARRYLASYHYLAGYVKLEAGEIAAAIEHLEQADPADPFSKLLLGRALERAGEAARAKEAYAEVLQSTMNTLDRALAYPEAQRRLGK